MSLWVIPKDRVMNIEVICHSCNSRFEVEIRKFNSYRKHGWNFYCSNCKNRKRLTTIKEICPVCNKEFIRHTYAKKSKNGFYFCSKSCAASYNNSHYRRGINNPNWIDGLHAGASYIKEAFRNYKAKCAICGLEEKCCLQVHHVDENRKNNSVDNLIVLCANCHNRVHRGGYKITKEILQNREIVQ